MNYLPQLVVDDEQVCLIHSIFILLLLLPSLEQDRLQLEHEYLLQQQMLTKSSTINDLSVLKKELDKSERQREQLSDHLEVYFIHSPPQTIHFFRFRC